MRYLVWYILVILMFTGCKKNQQHGPRVDIYLLESFTSSTDSTAPYTTSFSNTVLANKPLVADNDIRFYEPSSKTFTLAKDIGGIIKDYGGDKGFAVTVDGVPVYFGKFHPLYYSSMVLGLATIDPLSTPGKQLSIQFVQLDNNPALQQLDKRNDQRIINVFRATDRIR